MLEQEFKEEAAQETPESQGVVRQSAEEFLKEILGMEESKMFNAEPNNFSEYMTSYDEETGAYYTVKNPNYSPEPSKEEREMINR